VRRQYLLDARHPWPASGARALTASGARARIRAVSCAHVERQGATGTRRSEPGAVVNENFSLIVMIIFLVLSLAFLAQQISLYR